MEQKTILTQGNQEFSWHNYNKSQTREKDLFLNLLVDICSFIEEPSHDKVGRKPCKTRDVIFAITLKEYLNLSSRRLQSDLKLFHNIGFIDAEIPFNTLLDNLEREELKHILIRLIEISALPLKKMELDFAIDSTGFGTLRYKTFFNMKHGKEGRWKQYRKCHAVCGVRTNIITAIEITEGYSHDTKQFKPLAQDTNRNFNIREFSADKAYLSADHFALISEMGGQAFIPFKKNSTGKGASRNRAYFKKALRYFKESQKEYLNHYHKRSNIESSFSMIKRRFGNNVRCKKEASQDNEILAKVLAHNLCVLIQEMFLNNIEVDFSKCFKNYVARN